MPLTHEVGINSVDVFSDGTVHLHGASFHAVNPVP